jgi:uncharacterized protein (DUF849 family)
MPTVKGREQSAADAVVSSSQSATNGQLVERTKTIVEALGASVATPDEARLILGTRGTQ